ncbi:hypothetical protein [Bacillus sp. FJAT-50079]|uniref:hypothetical protein n=1 Tax=Bacillus sp. FJAT-50079 TaxID=2833577 RepID=UPI001BC8CA87|nr:hypothetical protein [Bacillus sp. FJAT-50079]MBS4207446.1 hypothetical protein [Bacillus sp. FJAT-50079]
MNSINIPFGLCEITYDDIKLPAMASDGVFSAIPTYKPMFGGALAETQRYILESYEVTFTVSIEHQSYETLKMHMQTLKDHQHGLYDDASNVNMEGKRLIVHPKGTDSKEYDLCILEAYISPEEGFKRTFKKEKDMFEITFIGKMAKNHVDGSLINSYFFIGDWEEALSKVGATNG